MSDGTQTHAAKKPKTTPAGTPIFSDLDLARLTIDGTPQGMEIKHATVKYGGERLVFQLSDAATSLRAPFGVDDGSKFGNKPSLKVELREPQRAFFQDELETKVKEAAIEHKATWFGAMKPLPDDAAVRAHGHLGPGVRADMDRFERRARRHEGLGREGEGEDDLRHCCLSPAKGGDRLPSRRWRAADVYCGGRVATQFCSASPA